MRYRSGSEGSFADFLRSGGYKRAAVVLTVGLILVAVAISGALGERDEAPKPTEEEMLTELCGSVDGVGRCRVAVIYDSEGNASAVAVVCDGAENTAVRAQLTDMLTTLLDIGSNRISILKFNE